MHWQGRGRRRSWINSWVVMQASAWKGWGIDTQCTGWDVNTGLPVREAAFHVSLYQYCVSCFVAAKWAGNCRQADLVMIFSLYTRRSSKCLRTRLSHRTENAMFQLQVWTSYYSLANFRLCAVRTNRAQERALWTARITPNINLLKTKRNLIHTWNQFVPRSKHFLPRL